MACESCGLRFLSSFEHVENDYYDRGGMHDNGAELKRWIRETEDDDDRHFAGLESLIAGKRVLDLGCGNGEYLLRARRAACALAGVDLDGAARHRLEALNIRFFRSLDETHGQYDIITLFHVLEHLTDPRALLVDLSRYLDPDGQVVIEVPNADDALFRLYECERFRRFVHWSCHLFEFNERTLIRILEQAGARVLNVLRVQRYPVTNHM